MIDLLSAAHSCHRILLCSQYVLCIPAIDDVCYLWYGPIIYNTSMCHCCMMLALLPMMDVYSVTDITQYMISKLHIVHTVKVTVWTFAIDLGNMLTTDIAPYKCCPSIMHNCHSIIAWCVLVMLSFYDTCSTCHRSMHYAAMQYCIVWSMGTTGITLYQHFVTARPSSVIGIKHNKCLFWDDIIHVIM